MKLALRLSSAGLIALLLASCGTSGSSSRGSSSAGVGPFDSRGNYVEAWADTPSKWKKGGGGGTPSKPGDSMAASDEPPLNSVPLPTPGNTRQPADIGPVVINRPVQKTSSSADRETVSRSTSKPTVSKTTAGKTASSRNSSERSTAEKTPVRKTTTNSETAAKSKTKPKTTVAAKTPTKKSSASGSYTIKKGDTLSAIASRNHTSVSAIQRANGISGAMIQPGKTLKIPK